MNSLNTRIYYALAILLAVDMTGCSSTKVQNKPEKTRVLGVPTATVETNPVILNLEATVRKSPNDPVAWSSLAKAYFDNKQYDQAVQAGNSSLQLQPDNADIRNIVFVSGLRIASASLDGIRKDQPLTGSNLTDAETLVGTIRQSLGETSLTGSTSTKPNTEKLSAHHVKKKKKVHSVKHEREDDDIPSTADTTAAASKPVVITNKPVGATAKPVQKPVVQASANNPFGAFQ